MDLLITPAWAQASGAAPQSPLLSYGMLIAIFVIFYFLLIRPQTKRAKEHRKMVAELKKDDEVATTGGIVGRISEVDDHFVTLDIAPNVAIKVQKFQVAQLMPKGTFKGA